MFRRCRLPGSALLLTLAATPTLAQDDDPARYSRQDPERIATAERCGECHVSSYEVWKRTPHASGFKSLHRKEQAEAIAGRLGFRLIKRQSLCLRCHYTPILTDGQLRAESGVSCESCHGAGRDWIEIHSDYGGGGADHRSESAEHRAERVGRARAAGMRRPSDLYPVAANCFGCHLVPEERLVNVGGHSTGSGDFELVKRSQGVIRHNFLASFLDGDGTENAERPPERLRRMYVVGRALELEQALRGVAAASEQGVYVKAMIRRVRNAVAELREIAARSPLPELETMLDHVRGVKVTLGRREELLAAAAAIGEANRAFLERHDGTALAALDPLIAGTAEPRVADAEPPAQAAPPSTATTADTARAPAAASGETGTAPEPVAGAATPTAPAPTGVVGERKTRIRPGSSHATLGQGSCSGCHAPQNEWWFDHPHYATTDPFFNQTAKALEIASLYGVAADQMTRGSQVCMDCHGTIVTGKEAREVLDGVSCESCHGPAGDWLEPHKVEEGSELGRERPAYRQALEQGKNDLVDLDVRGRVCAGCHYINDPRLLSAGHPSGIGFDYAQGMASVRHWEQPLAGVGALKQSWSQALKARGPLPEVRVATVTRSPRAADGRTTDTPQSAAVGSVAATSATDAALPRPPTPRPLPAWPTPVAGDAGGDGGGELEIAPLPESDAETPIEEILLRIKERLEQLQRRVQSQG